MIIATPSRSFVGERAGRNAAERPSPITWKWKLRSGASFSAEIASRIRLCSSGQGNGLQSIAGEPLLQGLANSGLRIAGSCNARARLHENSPD
jgi:hypothetical protein